MHDQWFMVPVTGFNSSFLKTSTWGAVDIADCWSNANNFLSVARTTFVVHPVKGMQC